MIVRVVMLTLSIMCVMAFMPRRLSDSGMKVVATMILIITTAMRTTSRRTGKESVHISQGLLLMHIQAKCLLQTIKKIWIILFPLKKFMMIRGEFLLNGMVQNWQMTLQIWHSLMSRSINQRKQTQWMRLFARCRKIEKIR